MIGLAIKSYLVTGIWLSGCTIGVKIGAENDELKHPSAVAVFAVFAWPVLMFGFVAKPWDR